VLSCILWFGEETVVRKRDKIIKLNLRLPEELHRRLESLAAKNEWSLNTEIIRRIQESFLNDLMRRSASKLLREGSVDQMLTDLIKKSLVELAQHLVILTEAEKTLDKERGSK
jgi:predicted DNA-binding protein